MEWERPTDIPFPKVWHTFDGLREINGDKPKFWIQDIPEEYVESVLETMGTSFVNEEPLCKFSKLSEDLESLAEAVGTYRYILSNKLSCVCMTNCENGKPRVVGLSALIRVSEDDPVFHPTTATYGRLRNITEYAYSFKSPYKHFGVSEYLCDRGIYVMPEYRKQGICYEFLKCWKVIGKAVGLKAAGGTFTSIFSQRIAKRAGFSELSSFNYVELGKVDPEFYLHGIEKHTKCLKILYVTF